MLIPMSLARPDRAYYYAFLCTWTSVAGGVVGYAIGALLYDSVGQWLISLYGYGDKVDAFREAYAQWGMWIILLKGLTPIPYKIVTITSGFAGYNLLLFIVFSVIARGGTVLPARLPAASLWRPGADHHRGAARFLGHACRHRHGGRHRRGHVPVLSNCSNSSPAEFSFLPFVRHKKSIGGVGRGSKTRLAGLARWPVRPRTQCRCDPPVADGLRSLPALFC